MVISRGSFTVFLVWSPPHTGRQDHLLAGWASVICLIFPLKSYFIKTCIISCDRTHHDSCYRDMGPYQQPIYMLFSFSLVSSQRGSIYCCPLFLKRSVFFFFKALNISKVKSVDTSLESLLSLFSSQGILNLSAVDNRKPNSLLSVIPYLACGGQLGEVALGNTIFRHILDSFCRRSWKHYDQKIYLQYKSNSFQICFGFLIFFTTDITNILR